MIVPQESNVTQMPTFPLFLTVMYEHLQYTVGVPGEPCVTLLGEKKSTASAAN
jgi:hypothetical protein